jgi:streptothricin acetyltransferase
MARQGIAALDVVRIVDAGDSRLQALARGDFSFEIRQEAVGPFDGGLGQVVPLRPPVVKRYGFDGEALAAHAGRQDQALFVAQLSGRAVGYAAVSEGWNRYAVVDDIAVDGAHRGQGAARVLMDAAVGWAKQRGLPGIRLETQSNNLGACRFYERYGFVLGGHDRWLYSALQPGTREVALFWYLRFEDA